LWKLTVAVVRRHHPLHIPATGLVTGDMADRLEQDVAAVSRIAGVPTILRTMRALTGLRFTLISRVTPERWVACAVHDEIDFGLKAGGELDVATTLCAEVRDSRRPILVEHASTDPVYCTHRTPKMYSFESYVAVPIFRRNGDYFGNICGLDPMPRDLKDGKTLAVLELFSELISLQLEAQEQYEGSRAELNAQREASKLREQFIAVLGHDVRNPLSSIVTGTELVLRRTKEPDDRRVLERVRSSSRRITALVDDLLDLARGRLGGGIVLELADADDLAERLRHVVAEVQASHPNRMIYFRFDSQGVLCCDAKRIEQLLSNLLANAVEHGAARTPITVTIEGNEQAFAVQVSNEGPPIPADKIGHLFEPYFRGQGGRQNGLGLGLYIVSEIAKAHGGKVEVASSEKRTSFTFTMSRPSRPAAP
jgi:signal transduction histidine kinase